ncbi:hypothetical protein BDV26DRAFT_93326 [Aspergillus bertholletiae]|uniref:Uncharacterized protein n=1 Tax=Aspergillus bertholletiae TaxID=1226010 RepID=A0A5N7BP99_9EURO|nr:hypothetical protein BDV26DRAFT_93326 [Aspergillus bertholletiae]
MATRDRPTPPTVGNLSTTDDVFLACCVGTTTHWLSQPKLSRMQRGERETRCLLGDRHGCSRWRDASGTNTMNKCDDVGGPIMDPFPRGNKNSKGNMSKGTNKHYTEEKAMTIRFVSLLQTPGGFGPATFSFLGHHVVSQCTLLLGSMSHGETKSVRWPGEPTRKAFAPQEQLVWFCCRLGTGKDKENQGTVRGTNRDQGLLRGSWGASFRGGKWVPRSLPGTA